MARQWAPGPLHSKRKIRVFLLQEVLFVVVIHSVCVSAYWHYTAQAQESLLNSGAKRQGSCYFRKLEVWYTVCCYGDIITSIKMRCSCITSILKKFKPVYLVFAQIFHILLVSTTLCHQCDFTSHLNPNQLLAFAETDAPIGNDRTRNSKKWKPFLSPLERVS